MAIPIVSLLVPLAVAPLELQELVAACDQSFALGDCVVVEDVPEPGSLVARLTWQSAVVVRVSVDMPAGERPGPESHGAQVLTFRPEDESRERYRAIGFSIGSHATRLYEGAAVAAVAVAAPTTSAPVPASTQRAVAKPAAPESAERVSPEALGRPWAFGADVSALIGTGVVQNRYGGALGVFTRAPGGIVFGGVFELSAQPRAETLVDGDAIAEQVDAAYVGGRAYAGVSIDAGAFRGVAAALIGVEGGRYSNPLTGAGDSRVVPLFGAMLQANWVTGFLQPFVRVIGTYGAEVPVQFSAPDGGDPAAQPFGSDGPWRLTGCLGLAFDSGS